MLKINTKKLLNNIMKSELMSPQALMTIEILTIELLATYALTHH